MVIEGFQVQLAGHTVAHLYARGDHTWLEWQQGYWDDPDRPVLGLFFEDQPSRRVASALRLPPWFSNLLPEGRLRDMVLRRGAGTVVRSTCCSGPAGTFPVR